MSLSKATQCFEYKPLVEEDEIRLLFLGPKSVNGSPKILCNLVHTTLRHLEADIVDHYTALSYVWGDPSDTLTIWVNDLPFQITRNLHAALSDLEEESRVLCIWVDAICINQRDNQEKSRQVMMMGKIYETAHHTLVYLGPLSNPLEALIEAIDSHSDIAKMEQQDSISRGAVEFFSHTWFSRIWVFQELVFSRDPRIQCGRIRRKWDHIQAYFGTISDVTTHWTSLLSSRHPSRGYEAFSTMQASRIAYQVSRLARKKNLPKLVDLVTSCRGSGATDPRDLIFALIGFAQQDIPGSGIKVDYSKSWQEVFQDVARYSIDQSGTFDVFHQIDRSPSDKCNSGLASWAPDWSQEAPAAGRKGHGYVYRSDDNTSTNREGVGHKWIQNPPVLACTGQRQDFIIRISAQTTDVLRRTLGERILEYHSRLRETTLGTSDLPDLVRDVGFFQVHYQMWREAIGLNILPAVKQVGEAHYKRLDQEDLAPSHFREKYSFAEILAAHLVLGTHHPQRKQAQNLSHELVMDNKIAISSKGWLCVVPNSACVGDVVVGAAIRHHSVETVLLRPLPVQDHPALDAQIRMQFSTPEGSVTHQASLKTIQHYSLVGFCGAECFLTTPFVNEVNSFKLYDMIAIH